MKLTGSIGAAAGALAVAISLGVTPASASAAEPLPGPVPLADTWYQEPDNLAAYANGDVIRSRTVEVKYPANAAWSMVKATQLLVRSSDAHGAPESTAATVMIPDRPWTGPGERPLLSVQVPTDSLGLQCNPSVTLTQGTDADLALVSPMLALGYAVVATDYEGPEMAWIAGYQAGHAVLDGIRASQRYAPLGLSKSPIVMYGYSGGGQATAWATELKASYAPELNVIGAAEGGVPGNLAELSARQPAAGFTAWGSLLGLSRAYPEQVRPQDYLNPEGIAFATGLTNQCLSDLLKNTDNVSLTQYSTVGNIPTLPSVRAVFEKNSLGRTANTPDMPLYVFHDSKDTLIPDWAMTGVVQEYCERGVDVQFVSGPGVGHVGYALLGMPAAYKWLDDRVMGRPTTPNCGAPVTPGLS
ncbi:lipase family protein [Rhodococcus sp. ABRD24]|uniref:lipase family protein n=1 Tax=Rhodococcus sp. ABRD24 TaxID=2507582 RepID=UPI0013F169A4|nr:lipase family protein [Rhodococcus sp. ABRD24]